MEERAPLISVLVANYNNGQYIEEAIHSVFGQTYVHWEIVIVDDASTDTSPTILDKYKGDSKVKIFVNEQNKGVGYTKRRCAANATGSICVLLDADDALKPMALEVVAKAYKNNPQAAMIVGGLELTDEVLKPKEETRQFLELPQGVNTILENGGAFGWDTFRLVNYKQTEGFVEFQKKAVDQDLYFKLEETGEIIFIEDCLYLYRENNDGISQGDNSIEALFYTIKAMESAIERRKNYSGLILKKLRKNKHHYYFEKGLKYYRDGNYSFMEKYIFKSLLLYPFKETYLKISLMLHPLKFWKKRST